MVVAGVDWPVTLSTAADRALDALESTDRSRWADEVGLGADGTTTALADAAAEAALLEYLAEELPSATLCSEEAGVVEGRGDGPGAGILLVVDPVDGTNNVLAGIPYWAVSIGVLIDGTAVGGLVRNAATGEDMFGWAGLGVSRGGLRAGTSDVSRIGDAAVALQRPADPCALERARQVFAACRLPRVLGSAALDLALVATGGLDAYVNVNTDPELPFGERVVDYAAGAIMVEAGGGVVTDVNGDPVPLRADLGLRVPLVAAATAELHEDLLDRLQTGAED